MNRTALPEWGLDQRGWLWAWSGLGSVLLHLLILVGFALADWLIVPVVTIQERVPMDPRVVFMRPGRTYVPTSVEQESLEPVTESALFSERSTQAANPEVDPELELGDLARMDGSQSRYLSAIERSDGMQLLEGEAAPQPPQGAPPTPAADVAPPAEEREASEPEMEGPQLPQADTGEAARAVADGSDTPPEEPAEQAAAESAEPSEAEAVSEPAPEEEPSLLEPEPEGSVTSSGAVLPESRTHVQAIQVGRIGMESFEVSQDVWGRYMKEVRERIGREWLHIVRLRWTGERVGEVTVHFEILPDGTLGQLRIVKNTVGVVPGSWCLSAVERSAPFPPFPEEIRNEFNPKRQKVDFTFHY